MSRFRIALLLGTTMALLPALAQIGAPDTSKESRVAPSECMRKEAPPGCPMMSAEEIRKFREKVDNAPTRKHCMDHMAAHHRDMKARAEKRGEKYSAEPGEKMCGHMKGK